VAIVVAMTAAAIAGPVQAQADDAAQVQIQMPSAQAKHPVWK
jgi:hypothetical protein